MPRLCDDDSPFALPLKWRACVAGERLLCNIILRDHWLGEDQSTMVRQLGGMVKDFYNDGRFYSNYRVKRGIQAAQPAAG